MKRYLSGGIEADITVNETGGFDVNIILPPKTYYSDEEYLKDKYEKVYDALIALKKMGIFSGEYNMPRITASPVSGIENEGKLVQKQPAQQKQKRKKAAKLRYASPSPKSAYVWEPNIHRKPIPIMFDPNGFTPHGGNTNSTTTLPLSNRRKLPITSKIKVKNKAESIKKNAGESMGTTAAKIFAKVSSGQDTNAKKEIVLTNVRDQWITQLKGECFKACAEILNAVKIEPIDGSTNQLQMALETSDHTSIHTTKDFDKGINYVDEQLDKGNGVRVGVNHTLNYKNGTLPNEPIGVPATTDHYVVIYGRGYDAQKKEYYYLYADVGSATKPYGINDKNKLYLDESAKTLSGLRPFKAIVKDAKGIVSYVDVTYTVTQVSANEENGK